MTKRILLAVDTNTASEPVKVAGDLAELSGTAAGQLRDWRIKARGVTVRADSPEKTAEAIIHQGLNPAVDILVLGLPKYHHLGRVFIGSVAADVAARTTMPLLLVPQSSGQE